MASHAIRAGEGDCFIAAGVETVSRYREGFSDSAPPNPQFNDAVLRTMDRSQGNGGPWNPPEGLPDIYIAMGQTAENVAEQENVGREEMDEFALRSQQRAVEAQKNGFFEREITPVTTPDGSLVTNDDGPRPDTTLEKLSQLKPAFRPDGTVTAGNACPLNDGAAATIVMSDTRADELGIAPLARVVSSGVTAVDPEIMGLGPIGASRQALARAGMTIDQIDLVEINEAFAAVVLRFVRDMGFDMDKVNGNGGAIAMGHPLGATGGMILGTLVDELGRQNKRYGLATLCIGGGMGIATVVERV